MAEYAKSTKHLQVLILKLNLITDKGAKIFRDVLESRGRPTGLTHLDLSENQIEDLGAIEIANGLKINRKLQKLNLWHNALTMECSKAFLEALDANNVIQSINLNQNQLEAPFLDYLEALSRKNHIKTTD